MNTETHSKDPVSSFFEGAGKECAKEGIDIIKDILNKIVNAKYSFIGERKTIDNVKKQKHSPEFRFYSNYLNSKDIKFQIKMGLTLRILEEEKDYDRINHLREIIVKKYDIEGLHIAELAQNKILMKYILYHFEEGKSEEKIKVELNSFLEGIEKNTFFIQNVQSAGEVIKEISLKIQVHSPKIFIIASKGSSLVLSSQIFDQLIKLNEGKYDYKRYKDNKEDILFLSKSISIFF